MKKLILLNIFLFIFITHSSSQVKNTLIGKSYVREVSTVCKSFSDGGCLITNFELFQFSADSIHISYFTKADCDIKEQSDRYTSTSKGKTYSYQIQKKKNSSNLIIRIDNYNIGSFESNGNQLIELNMDKKKREKIVYNLEE